jgi:hypothetical protein
MAGKRKVHVVNSKPLMLDRAGTVRVARVQRKPRAWWANPLVAGVAVIALGVVGARLSGLDPAALLKAATHAQPATQPANPSPAIVPPAPIPLPTFAQPASRPTLETPVH